MEFIDSEYMAILDAIYIIYSLKTGKYSRMEFIDSEYMAVSMLYIH